MVEAVRKLEVMYVMCPLVANRTLLPLSPGTPLGPIGNDRDCMLSVTADMVLERSCGSSQGGRPVRKVHVHTPSRANSYLGL
jgi:hypothetical protein